MIDALSDQTERTPPSPAVPAYAEVAVDGVAAGRGSGVLSYAVPTRWGGDLVVGQLVWAPLRKTFVLGVVTELGSERPTMDVRPLHAVVEPAFRLDEDRLDIARWVARETACSLFAALAPFLPPGVTHRTTESVRLVERDGTLPEDLTTAQRTLASLLADRGEMSLDAARAATGQALTTVIPKLEARGVIERVARVADSEPRQRTERFLRLLVDDENPVGRSPKQQAGRAALLRQRRLRRDGEEDIVATAAVRRRTGVDRATISALIAKGVVEEVELTLDNAPLPRPAPAPLLTEEQAAVWRSIAAGRTRVVVGPRSALFAPVSDLGLIVLDEEHEGAYKQESDPRYHARRLAEFLAARAGASIVLGSATPAVETTWRGGGGGGGQLRFPARSGVFPPRA